ncbi:hypothetical protein JCM19235_1349 [Vibrio maritimus]|uniref:Uncharacterized protein n=1 Tax=Vibrio maritimus TaxID=990268 RepID=A0A090S8E2_9VIBR|nr:hypothetical protein JCM19235_1349 [Vibrio maritimus]
MTVRTGAFVHRDFQEARPEHKVLEFRDLEELELDSPVYDWEYFGTQKYGRYAVCKNTKIKRGLTMGEFYGESTVD